MPFPIFVRDAPLRIPIIRKIKCPKMSHKKAQNAGKKQNVF